MKRNTINKIALGIMLAAVCGLTSCDKLLKEKPKTDIDLNDFFGKDNESKLNALLTGTYGQLQKVVASGGFIGVAGTDELMNNTTNTNVTPQDRYTHSSGMTVFYNNWRNHYYVIRDANVVISRTLYVNDVSDRVKDNILGQARFLRAYAYFCLVRYYGELPLMLEETVDFNQAILSKGRSSIQDVYEAIISDLTYASQDGVLSRDKDGGRVTYWVARALLAKVYLTLGTYMDSYESAPANPVKNNPHSTDPLQLSTGYKELWHQIKGYDDMRRAGYDPQEMYRRAYDLLNEIVSSGVFSLNEVYGDSFDWEQKNITPESIWEIQFSSVSGWGSNWSKQFGLNSGANHRAFNGMAGNCVYKAVPSFWFKYRLGDVRREWNIKPWRLASDDLTNPGLTTADNQNLDMNTNDPATMKTICENSWLNTNLGVTKYRWGSKSDNPDPDQFYNVQSKFAQTDCPNNYIVLRYADVLLMLVETDMLLNDGVPSDRALDIMNNQILRRARGGKTAQEVIDQWKEDSTYQDYEDSCFLLDYDRTTLTYDALIEERGREFMAEFQRWFDLVRTGRLKDRVESRRTLDSSASLLEGKVEARHYLFPISQQERDASHDKEAFFQNPGY